MTSPAAHALVPPPKGEGGAEGAGWGVLPNKLSPHPASLGYRLRSATLPEDGEGSAVEWRISEMITGVIANRGIV